MSTTRMPAARRSVMDVEDRRRRPSDNARELGSPYGRLTSHAQAALTGP